MSKFKRSCQKWTSETEALNDVLSQNPTIKAFDLVANHDARSFVWVTKTEMVKESLKFNKNLTTEKVAIENAMATFDTCEANINVVETDTEYVLTTKR